LHIDNNGDTDADIKTDRDKDMDMDMDTDWDTRHGHLSKLWQHFISMINLFAVVRMILRAKGNH
jgi:hypothetical protein